MLLFHHSFDALRNVDSVPDGSKVLVDLGWACGPASEAGDTHVTKSRPKAVFGNVVGR